MTDQEDWDAGVERILVVAAHPDDVDFGSAGSVATWTDRGIEVTYCIVTDGDAGGFDPAVPRREIAGIRQREQTEAAKEVGVDALHFLGHPDGALYPTHEVRRDISRVIRQVRPQRVVCPSPDRQLDRIYASHPDHLAAGEATICAVYPDARNPFAHPELLQQGFEAWAVPEVWVTGGPQPDRWVDTTDAIDRKISALLRHQSQHQDPSWIPEGMRAWGAENAKRVGLPEGRLAETYRRIATA